MAVARQQLEEMMASDLPREVVRHYLSAMEAMDFDTALTCVADDVLYINSPDTTAHGHAGVRDVLEPFFAPIEENEFVIHRTVAEGDTVFVERLDRHRVPQGWFELPVAGVFEVQSGKITYWREYFDLQTVIDAMQALMAPQS